MLQPFGRCVSLARCCCRQLPRTTFPQMFTWTGEELPHGRSIAASEFQQGRKEILYFLRCPHGRAYVLCSSCNGPAYSTNAYYIGCTAMSATASMKVVCSNSTFGSLYYYLTSNTCSGASTLATSIPLTGPTCLPGGNGTFTQQVRERSGLAFDDDCLTIDGRSCSLDTTLSKGTAAPRQNYISLCHRFNRDAYLAAGVLHG